MIVVQYSSSYKATPSVDKVSLQEGWPLLTKIWPDKRDGLGWEGFYKRGITMQSSGISHPASTLSSIITTYTMFSSQLFFTGINTSLFMKITSWALRKTFKKITRRHKLQAFQKLPVDFEGGPFCKSPVNCNTILSEICQFDPEEEHQRHPLLSENCRFTLKTDLS